MNKNLVLALLAVVHWHAAHAVLVKDGVYSFTTCNKEGPTGLYEIEAFGAQGGKAKPTGSERGGYGVRLCTSMGWRHLQHAVEKCRNKEYLNAC